MACNRLSVSLSARLIASKALGGLLVLDERRCALARHPFDISIVYSYLT